MKTNSKNPAFLTVVETMIHQRTDEQALSAESNYQVTLESSQDAYVRRKLEVGPDWTPIPGNWLDSCSEFLLKNDTGRGLKVYPTEEEAADMARKVIEVGLVGDVATNVWLVAPNRSMRASPRDIRDVRIRCQHGVTECTIAIFPK